MYWKTFIEREFVKYQNREGRPVLKTDFADWLNQGSPTRIDLATLSHWLNGRRIPNDTKLLDHLAAKLGTEVYSAAGATPRLPDNPSLIRISRILPTLPPEVQETFAAWAEEMATTANDPARTNTTLSFQVQIP